MRVINLGRSTNQDISLDSRSPESDGIDDGDAGDKFVRQQRRLEFELIEILIARVARSLLPSSTESPESLLTH